MPLDDRQLMQLAIDTRFTYAADGRIGYENEPGGWRAPRFVIARTAVANLWRVRDDLSPRIAQQLDALAAAEPVRPDIRVAPERLEAFQRVLSSDDVDGGPNYRFPDDVAMPEGTTSIIYQNRGLMRQMVSDFDTFSAEFAGRQPRRAILLDGVAVSVCWSARLGERAAEAGVETLAQFRGRGYAAAVVAAWAHDVRAGGRVPLYGTSWDNAASRALARKLRLIAFGSVWDLA